MPRPLLIDPKDCADEKWSDPNRGSYRYRQMLSSSITDSDSFAAGIMTFSAGDQWAVHRHPEAEVYFGLEGEADVEVDGRLYRLKPETLLFIPGGSFHGVPPTPDRLRFFYAFATDRLENISYTFRDEA